MLVEPDEKRTVAFFDGQDQDLSEVADEVRVIARNRRG